ncbi:MAG: hypothetical protein HY475_03150 [Candidatus Terrybacteria bacterium]|nr:hypothetical protein [Candidatus Terrybacteria bacterium]
MILVSHVLIGGAIGATFREPALAVPLALASHYLLDAIPHREYRIARLEAGFRDNGSIVELLAVFADLALGFAILLALAPPPLAIVAGFTAALPDAVTFLSFLLRENGILRAQRVFHRRIHLMRREQVPWLLAVLTQGSAVLVGVFAILAAG